jgi:hypothetical protein
MLRLQPRGLTIFERVNTSILFPSKHGSKEVLQSYDKVMLHPPVCAGGIGRTPVPSYHRNATGEKVVFTREAALRPARCKDSKLASGAASIG